MRYILHLQYLNGRLPTFFISYSDLLVPNYDITAFHNFKRESKSHFIIVKWLDNKKSLPL